MVSRKNNRNILNLHTLVPLVGIVLVLVMLAVTFVATNKSFNTSIDSHAADPRSCEESHGVPPQCQQVCENFKTAEVMWTPIKARPNAYSPDQFDYWSNQYRQTKAAYNTCMQDIKPPSSNPSPAPTVSQRDLNSYACSSDGDCRNRFANSNLYCNTANPRRCVYFDCRKTDANHANPQSSCPRNDSCDEETGQCVGPKLLDCSLVGMPSGICRTNCRSNEQVNDYAGYCGGQSHCCFGNGANDQGGSAPADTPTPLPHRGGGGGGGSRSLME